MKAFKRVLTLTASALCLSGALPLGPAYAQGGGGFHYSRELPREGTANSGVSSSKKRAANNAFAFKLFDEVAKNKKENVLVSPFSAYAALCMTANGASGKTREQMSKVLGIDSSTLEEVNKRNQAIFSKMRSNDKVQLEVGNAIYSDRNTPFKQEFISECKKFYDAEAHSEDFADPAVVGKINAWCNQKTHGKIPKILDKLTRDEKMVLLNAIYFKGTWAHKFEKNLTQDDRFQGLKGEVPVKMMHQNDAGLMYMKAAHFQSIALPYAGEHQRMMIFLPDQNSDIAAFEAELSNDNWNKWMHSYHHAKVNVSMPRFKLEYSKLLNKELIAMGMSDAFSSNSADFSNMIDTKRERAWISRVLQKTYMDVYEEGTEAAAVTAVVMATAAAAHMPQPPIEFRVDRPFVLALVDDDTDQILFLGAVTNP